MDHGVHAKDELCTKLANPKTYVIININGNLKSKFWQYSFDNQEGLAVQNQLETWGINVFELTDNNRI